VVPERPAGLSTFARLILALAGAVTFVAVNVLMYLSQCSSTEFMLTCRGGNGDYAFHVIAAAAGLGIGSFLSTRVRAFASGFAGMLVAMTVVSLGGCTKAWSDPYVAVRKATQPARDRAARERKKDEAVRLWTELTSREPMDIPAGMRFAGTATQCAHRFARENGRNASSLDELGQSCSDLRAITYKRADSQDAGWRVAYAPSGDGFSIDIAPDELLSHKWPRIHSDGVSRFEIRMSAGAAPISISPAAELRDMSVCLKEIPEDRSHLTPVAKRLCPALAARIRPLLPAEEDAIELAVVRAVGPENSPMTIAKYRVELSQGALVATPLTVGLPRFRATFDGKISWINECPACLP
jgi:hypothetical protein